MTLRYYYIFECHTNLETVKYHLFCIYIAFGLYSTELINSLGIEHM